METIARNLILAGEISGFLHDLGKLHPGFADENLTGGSGNKSEDSKKHAGIYAAHGAILEEGRIYPNEQLDGLNKLLNHEGWAESMTLPAEWVKPNTVQVTGLGAPLRQHHASNDWPDLEASLLGDVYAMGADIRDSALDKASGGAKNGKQNNNYAHIADSFGQKQLDYSQDILQEQWQQVPKLLQILWQDGAWQDVATTRKKLYQNWACVLQKALGETRRPTHDVTLWHHSYSTASHFKAVLAEGVLRQDFTRWQNQKGLFDTGQMGLIRFRLLGIRWDWNALTRQAFRPVTLVSLTLCRDEVIAAIRQVVEVDHPIGNIIYQDDDGVLILAPGFYEADANSSEALFAQHVLDPLQERLTQCVAGFGPGTSYRLHWSSPTLYLTDYPEALGLVADSPRQRFLQAGESELRRLWAAAPERYQGQQIQICPQCGLRPAPTREFALVESSLSEQSLCDFCEDLHSEQAMQDRSQMAQDVFGFTPHSFNLHEIARKRGGGNQRMALISLRVDTLALANGNALITQLARPADLLEKNTHKLSANGLGDWFEELLKDLRNNNTTRIKTFERTKSEKGNKKEDSAEAIQARNFIGDSYWLNDRDGRVMGKGIAPNALEIAQEFFLRETRHLPAELGLYRHEGDRLALFAQRKHPSPARLQRLWDNLRSLWGDILEEVAGLTGNALMPLSLDAGGVRFLVSAPDATAAIKAAQRHLDQSLNKVRGGIAPQVSCVVFKEKFPLYLALDSIYRMEARIPGIPHQEWRVCHSEALPDKRRRIVWQTPQGEVVWTVDLATGDPDDPEQLDLWHPHVIRSVSAAQPINGPDRLTHVTQLRPGDICLIPPATFDFMVLEGGGRRYQIAYDQRSDRQLYRPHLVFGAQGQAIGLLEQFESLATLIQRTRWNSSQVKGLQGEMIELYEKWVRDVPGEALRTTGKAAWLTHIEAMLRRYLPGKDQAPLREELRHAIENGRFFNAVEWTSFISKSGETTS